MKKSLTLHLFAFACLSSAFLSAQAPFSFVNANSKFTSAAFHSGNSLSVVDMDCDGLDDIARLDDANDLYYTLQRTGQTFNNIHAISTGTGNSWGMVVGDADNNGIRDVAVGYGNRGVVVKASAGWSFSSAVRLPNDNFLWQNMNFADINNDGWIDIFGNDDNAASKMWGNDGTGSFPATTNFFSTNAYPPAGSTGTVDNSGNYGSIWTDVDNDGDIDLYIAHCRLSTSGNDNRRVDQFFINDGSNHYVLDSFNTRGLNNYSMTWTSSFEDIDNDGDLDCLLTQTDVPSQLFLNDGNGYFTEITNGSGFVLDVTAYESKMEDLDNDGFVDIIISGDDSRVFHNNHNHTFSLVTGLFDGNNMLSFATGDLNHDGKIDLYTSYGQAYNAPTNTNDVLWMNSTENGNHFITFNLQGTLSNRDALGSRVEIYGAWGKQIREVRAGESYGTTNSFMCHFGLGTATMVDSVIVRWPKGLITRLYNRPADQFITVIEAQCSSPDNNISFSGPSVLCTGQSVTITAVAGYDYLWSTGETTQSISTSVPGDFTVKVSDISSGCSSISQMTSILYEPNQTPTISLAGPTTFCEGSNLILQGSPASAYLWSNGDTTQSTVATSAGNYTLTIQGTCTSFTSLLVQISVIPSHVSNVVSAATCEDSHAPVTLQANGSGRVFWYDSIAAGTSISSGNSYATPPLANTTTYYVESHDTVFGISGEVGPVSNTVGFGGYLPQGFNISEVFDVFRPLILRSVVVYANSNKSRTIELRNSSGTILQTKTQNLPQGKDTITLNFDIPVGRDYQLGWSGTNPDLYRNTGGITYPYTLDSLISITGNTLPDPTRWYCYYDWQVEEQPHSCVSIRIPVIATVNANPVVVLSGLDAQYYNSDGIDTITGTPSGGIFSGAGVVGNTFDPYVAGTGGPYTISYSYIDQNGCSAAATFGVTVLQDTASGVKPVEGINDVQVMPNPNQGEFELNIRLSGATIFDLAITDMLGQVVIDKREIFANGEYRVHINLNDKAKGIYHLVITSGKNRNTYKLAVQ